MGSANSKKKNRKKEKQKRVLTNNSQVNQIYISSSQYVKIKIAFWEYLSNINKCY